MKKIYLILIITGLISCQAKEKQIAGTNDVNYKQASYVKQEKYNKEDIQFLKDMGMTSSMTFKENVDMINNEAIRRNEEKYGVKFIPEDKMNVFLSEHDLVMGGLADYKYIIPVEALKTFRTNLLKVTSIDSSLHNFYFIRISRQAEQRPGQFLQKIDASEIVPGTHNLVTVGPSLANGQHYDLAKQGQLISSQLMKYSKKYNLSPELIVVDGFGFTPLIRIVAQKEYFELEGKDIVDNKIVPKDPAIVLGVPGGWLTLAVW